ncbi:CaiB/BaiF CoA-transferase family protein [Motiliproteus sp. MSK22-1]|uniref:CaiB/BaiF CoA transferase family protein n=1 Tax=Motiliproteus sp. MSK22-1 TaxID=1897630 RepID=UPI00117E5D5E|nr:CaiB/BaiF CoA-transferase family protein [Motiliproteus sp. MSK22-1]
MQQQTVTKPLEGLLVISIEQALAAPLCSCRLADAGARVIKVERDAGDFARGYDSAVNGESSYFVWTNRGKESVVVDIKSADGLELMHKMLAQADVFIQNLAPGATARIGLDSDSLRTRYPRLITCDISGYGEAGEYKDMKAYDLLIQSESGLVSVSGAAEGYGRIGVSICDIGAGMNALSGIQQALLKREKTGQGSAIKVSLFDGAADWMSVPILHQKYTGKGPARVGLKHPSIAPYGEFKSSEGKSLVLSIQNNREWQRFCEEILEQPDLVDDPRFSSNNQRVAHRPELDELISHRFNDFNSAELRQRLQTSGIAFGSVNHTEDLVSHPQLRYTRVQTPSGPADIVAPPVIFDKDPIAFNPVPALGEHTASIFAEFSTNK